ncbi:MAG: hypothetical protein FIA94_02840 [Nitrospirae bacterium]|nr:hypothetical protein [Nitrospirota bacterium]
MANYIKIILRIFLLLLFSFLTLGCASFKPANIDETTGQFPASAEVDKQYIKIYQPLAGIKEANYVYLLARSPYGNDKFYSFMKDALIKIGFKKVYSRKELSQLVIKSGLSTYITDLSDPISLNNLAKATGPFIILDSNVFPVADVVFRFDVQVIEPLSGDTYLEISRIRTNWLDMDKEINYPILNVIKQWHDESAKLPYEKHNAKMPKEGTI